MSIVIDGGRVPKLLSRKNRPHSPSADVREVPAVRVALINNMPDAALEDTEVQFFELLDAAAGDTTGFSQTLLTARIFRGAMQDSNI